ncbi:MAG: hypothetical protein AB1512_02985 [Thermodesulfobacteriota bacterium]
MSTRAMVAFQERCGSPYSVFYRHCDGYPTGLGLDLMRALKKAQDPGKVARKADLKYDRLFSGDEYHPRIYPVCQADLDWFYLVSPDGPEHTSVTIFKTGNPYLEGGVSWRVWFCYLKYLPEDLERELRFVEISAWGTLQALREVQRLLEAGAGAPRPESGEDRASLLERNPGETPSGRMPDGSPTMGLR